MKAWMNAEDKPSKEIRPCVHLLEPNRVEAKDTENKVITATSQDSGTEIKN